jgi:hypothetical protein
VVFLVGAKMATNIRVGIDVSDNGSTEKVNKRVKNLHDMLKQTQAAAAGINVGGGTAGSRGVAAAARPGVVAAAEVADYGRMRGAAGATGASARDFANQAQGLGGLVRLYATFAANIFAVSAAFNGLREAMNTTNMVKGLDMLGAASGQNLGSLSKRLVETTNGALSMRDAMESVAKATSAGMGQKDLLRLTEVAKNASSVLGLNLPDAMSRLTRAVTKLEPELLDELGIMTRIEPAVEAYARQTGRAASSLSQMERQQAFLNAVLAEGEQKFGALGATVTNPYDKLLATLKDVLQTGLEFVNKFIAPLVNLLASSPTGLALALGALGIALVRQALPALTQFKAGLAKSAEDAKKLAIQKQADSEKAQAGIRAIVLKDLEADAEKRLKIVDRAEAKLKTLREKGFSEQSAAFKALQKENIQAIEKTEIAAIRAEARQAKAAGNKDLALAYTQTANAIARSQKAEETYAAKSAEVTKEYQNKSAAIRTANAAQEAHESSVKKGIISNAAYNTGLIGMTGSWKLMKAEIESSGLELNKFERGILKARGAVAILGGAIGALGTALNAALGWIGLIVVAVGIFDSVFSKGSKQISDFNSALDGLESNAEAAARTVERLNNTKGTGTIQGISAISNSLRELGDSAEDAVQKMLRAQMNMSGWDKFKDAIASVFGGGLEKNLAESIGKSVNSALSTVAGLPLGETAREQFSSLLGTVDLSAKGVETAFQKLNETGKKAVTEFIKELGKQTTESTNRLNAFKSSVEATTKSFQQFIQSTAISDPLFTLGNNLQDVVIAMTNLQNKGVKELDAALLEFAKDPSKAQLFGPEFVRGIIAISDDLKTATTSITASSREVFDYQTKINTVTAEITKLQKVVDTPISLFDATQNEQAWVAKENIKKLRKELELLQAGQKRAAGGVTGASDEQTNAIVEARNLFSKAIEGTFQRGAKLVEQALGNASEKARLTLEKTRVQFLSGPRRAEEEIRLQREDINIRLRAIDTNIDLILSQEKLSAEMALANAIAREERARKEGKGVEEAEQQTQVARITTDTLKTASEGKITDLIRALDVLVTQGKTTGVPETVLKQVRLNLTGVARQIAGQQASGKIIQAEGQALDITGPLRVQKERNAEVEKFLKLIQDVNQAELTLLNTVNSIAGETTQIGVELQNQIDLNALSVKFRQDANRLTEREAEIAAAGNKAEEVAVFNLERDLVAKKQSFEITNLLQQQAQRTLNFELQGLTKTAELERARQQLRFSGQQLELDALSQQNQAYSNLYGTVNSFVLLQQDQLARQQAQLQLTREQATITANLREKEAQADAQKRAVVDPTSAAGVQAIAAINERIEREQRLADVSRQAAQDQYNQNIRILNVTKQINTEQERYNSLVQSSTGIAESLKGIFDGAADSMKNLADAVGTLVTKTTEYGITSEKNQKALLQADDAIIKKKAEIRAIEESGDDAAPQIKALEKLEEARGDQIKKNTRDEITGAAQIAGASKKLFKEKTVAYKLLAATEKVLHITRLAMDAKELFMKLKTTAASAAAVASGQAAETAATGAGFFARAGIYISEIFAKFTAMLGPFGPPLAVAAIAAIGLSAFGRKGGGGNFMPSAEQRQQTQGTAMGYNEQGQQVQVRRGVFGDTEAKSQSIDNSLKIIKENSVDGLSYQNKMLLALERLNKAIEGTAKGLYRIAGLRTGTAFGTETGTQTLSTGFLGASFLGGKTQTKDIIDSGIQVKGSFLDLANGVRGTIQIFETIQTTLKNSGFLGFGRKTTTTRETVFTDLFGIDPKAAENISKAFDYGRDLLVSTAEFAGISETAVNQILGTIRLEEFASLRGLKGEDFAKELQAVLGSVLDDAALAIFATFTDYERFGEGMLETVIRVTDTNKKVIQAIKNTSFSQLAAGAGTFGITEALVDSAGGLDTLLSSLETFRQNFLTETAQLLPIQESVTEELNRLGLGFVKTKEQFAKELISLDIIASETDRSTFTSLLKIQDNFLKVTKAAEEASEKQQQEAEALNKRLLELQGQTQVLREKELAAISETNRVLQERIYALEDLKTTEQNLATAQDKVKSIQDRATDAYIQASQKVADAQQNIANQAVEAAKKMRDFAKTLREFIQQQVSVNNQQFGVQQFQQAVQQALGGDQQSLANIQQLAESAIESARATSRSSREFEATRRQVLSSVIEVAKFAEAQAALVQIPEEDPQKQAQKALEDALAVQQQALLVAQATSAALVKLPENLVEQYLVAKQQLNEAILARINAESAATRLELTFTAISEDIRKLVQVNETGLGIVGTNTGTTASNTANLRVTLDDMMRGVAESVELSIKNSQPITRGYGFDVAGPPSPYSMIYNQMVGSLGGEQADSLARKLAEDPVLRKSVLGWSMGGVFGTTMQKYAQGGAFTNQIVDRPTGFNLGVMGEAGPEAILPLTRIGGRLGVTAELPQFAQPEQSNAQLLQEIVKLRKEVENLRVEARVTAVSSNKTYRLFERITTDGEALNVVTVS